MQVEPGLDSFLSFKTVFCIFLVILQNLNLTIMSFCNNLHFYSGFKLSFANFSWSNPQKAENTTVRKKKSSETHSRNDYVTHLLPADALHLISVPPTCQFNPCYQYYNKIHNIKAQTLFLVRRCLLKHLFLYKGSRGLIIISISEAACASQF